GMHVDRGLESVVDDLTLAHPYGRRRERLVLVGVLERPELHFVPVAEDELAVEDLAHEGDVRAYCARGRRASIHVVVAEVDRLRQVAGPVLVDGLDAASHVVSPFLKLWAVPT